MKLPITKEWFQERAAAEGDHEIGAGRRLTKTLNLSPDEIAELERLAFEALPAWARTEITALRSERDELRFKVSASALTDRQLAEEMAAMQSAFSNRGEHGGSPGGWSYERMGEIATEQQRRTASKPKGCAE